MAEKNKSLHMDTNPDRYTSPEWFSARVPIVDSQQFFLGHGFGTVGPLCTRAVARSRTKVWPLAAHYLSTFNCSAADALPEQKLCIKEVCGLLTSATVTSARGDHRHAPCSSVWHAMATIKSGANHSLT